MTERKSTSHISSGTQSEEEALLLEGEIYDIFQRELGMATEIAMTTAKATVDGLRRRLGAQRIYIPSPSRAARDAAILREWNGQNTAEICKKHGISRPRLYQIASKKKDSPWSAVNQ